ncbi:hypothetical protein DB32_007759 [Sandaracinus amylolyticus]|uniref:Extensin-like C-terminal domain-containing protein n=1 Tax=Sandaracinus amylolyticus TaxID=927083 RepID=A0A0F6YLQ2_9BACT|nr:hypothetical protein DB32_007759 [Sandaracinus amylolyticus]
MVKLSNGRIARASLVLSILVAIAMIAASSAKAQLDLGWLFGRRGPSYALDDIARRGQDTSICQPEIMVPYRGTALRYSGTVRVHPAFLERLPELERVAIEVATEIYGRAPHRLIHAGAYNCRSVRGNRGRLSEHALGNALDVRGFEFRALPRRTRAPEGLPRALRRGFTVSLERHWEAESETGAVHQRFLRTLIERLAREDVFRVIYGPAHPGHRNHFHFDMSPFRWIHV